MLKLHEDLRSPSAPPLPSAMKIAKKNIKVANLNITKRHKLIHSWGFALREGLFAENK